jgi:hypothetical protein
VARGTVAHATTTIRTAQEKNNRRSSEDEFLK